MVNERGANGLGARNPKRTSVCIDWKRTSVCIGID